MFTIKEKIPNIPFKEDIQALADRLNLCARSWRRYVRIPDACFA